MESISGPHRSRWGKRHLVLFLALAIVLIGAKGCKKKPSGYGTATTNSGYDYWYYVGANPYEGSLFIGGLWCQSSEPTGPTGLFCEGDLDVQIQTNTATITCTNTNHVVVITCGF